MKINGGGKMADIIRDDFFKIGFGFLILALRLGMVRYILRRAGEVPVSFANELISRGTYITIIGLVVAGLGIVRGWSSSEGIVMITAGAGTAVLLGLSWVLQGTVQVGRGTLRSISRLAGVTAIIGVVLIAMHLNAVY
jgi:hypothetical protein